MDKYENNRSRNCRDAEIDVLTAGVGQKHRSIVGFTGLGGEQALDLHLAMFERAAAVFGINDFSVSQESGLFSTNGR